MASTAIASYFPESDDVHLHQMTKIAFNAEPLLNLITKFPDLLLSQILGAFLKIDLEMLENLAARSPTDAENIREGNLHSLVIRYVDSSDTCHMYNSVRMRSPR